MNIYVDATKKTMSPTKKIMPDSSTVFKNEYLLDAKNTNADFEASFLGNGPYSKVKHFHKMLVLFSATHHIATYVLPFVTSLKMMLGCFLIYFIMTTCSISIEFCAAILNRITCNTVL